MYPSSLADGFPLQTTAKLRPTMSGHRGRHFLQIPGPTNVPDRVLRAIAAPTIDHRGPEFAALAADAARAAAAVFRTSGPVVVYPASGTGRVGGRARQHALARRPRAGVRDRPLRDAVARPGPAARPAGRVRRRATGATASTRPRSTSGSPATREHAHPRGLRRAQRDVHRRHAAASPRSARRWTPPAIPRCCWSTRSRRWARSTTATTSGASTSPWPARRRA